MLDDFSESRVNVVSQLLSSSAGMGWLGAVMALVPDELSNRKSRVNVVSRVYTSR